MRGNNGDALEHPRFDYWSDLFKGELKSQKDSSKPPTKKSGNPKRRLHQLGAADDGKPLDKAQARILVAALEPLQVTPVRIARLGLVADPKERAALCARLRTALVEAEQRAADILRDVGCDNQFPPRAERIIRKTLLLHIIMIDKQLSGEDSAPRP